MTPAPSLRHQTISKRLFLELVRILVVSNDRRGILAPEGLRGSPDLVEILSPATAHRDRGIKHRLYERHGVTEYWVVDPDLAAVEVWRFASEPRHERFVDRLPVRLGDEIVGEIDLTAVFASD